MSSRSEVAIDDTGSSHSLGLALVFVVLAAVTAHILREGPRGRSGTGAIS